MGDEIRLARPADAVRLVTAVVAEAYEPWIAIVGFRVGPLDADYAELIEAGQVYVAGGPEIDALLVLIEEDD